MTKKQIDKWGKRTEFAVCAVVSLILAAMTDIVINGVPLGLVSVSILWFVILTGISAAFLGDKTLRE